MRVAIYARVSSEAQEARGTIGSQVEALRRRLSELGHEVVSEFLDDGYSGARLNRPGLDALRDAAEAGRFEELWCLTPDRLARSYAYQILVLDELARCGVQVRFLDAPPIADDPQAKLLVQVQGVIAEYERAKITERHRRGKLFRARAGEIVYWRVPYGYRRLPRGPGGPSHLEIYEPEAVVVRRIFNDYVSDGCSVREIARRLYQAGVPTWSGHEVWTTSTLSGMLRNPAYMGKSVYNRHESVPASHPGPRSFLQRRRPKEEWIEIPVPAIVSEDLFVAAQRVSRDNSQFSRRRAIPGSWLLRYLVTCGQCGIKMGCQRTPTSRGGYNMYYLCHYRDALRAGGAERRCAEAATRANELDALVWDEVRNVLLQPEVLLSGERELVAHAAVPDDQLLAEQLERLRRRLEQVEAERRRLIDVYQAGLVDLADVQRREAEIDNRRRQLEHQRDTLVAERHDLASKTQLRQRVETFAVRVRHNIDSLGFEERQRLLRLLIDEVRVTGCKVDIRLRIPLDELPPAPAPTTPRRPRRKPSPAVSTDLRLRSLGALHPRTFPH
jgi:site-specific DNA recombinase